VPPFIRSLIDEGALFFVSHSAGKDSQAAFLFLSTLVPREQLVVVHAHLRRAAWPGAIEHIEDTTGMPVHVVEADLDLLQMAERRGKWFSPRFRYCTSDAKRGPIDKFVRAEMNRRGATVGVDCTGLRGDESRDRARKPVLKRLDRLCTRSRTVYAWLPIHSFTQVQVFATIEAAGQKPIYAYALGNRRFSCVFCIMGCGGDILNGAIHNPRLVADYDAVERSTGHTLFLRNGKPIRLADRIDQLAAA
jgi:3'-phosphoadenosine 5'-phosphosulfate sulfotransferase (PAPS reductase)/FAD synthetase